MLGLANNNLSNMPQMGKPAWLAVPNPQCCSLDGTGDYVNCGDISGTLDGGDAFTFGIWLKCDGNTGDVANSMFISHNGVAGVDDVRMAILANNDTSTIEIQFNTSGWILYAPNVVDQVTRGQVIGYSFRTGSDKANQWFPVIFGWDKDLDSGHCKVYIGDRWQISYYGDSARVSTDSMETMSGNTAEKSLYIGASYALGSILSEEKIDCRDVAVWDRKLTDNEMEQFCMGYSPADIVGTGNRPRHHWKLAGTGETEDRGAGTDSDATLVGNATITASAVDAT
tara:strand:+ start:636 stop:1484 length:849 start_codon:yes stop_codon:yes gene_type:complete